MSTFLYILGITFLIMIGSETIDFSFNSQCRSDSYNKAVSKMAQGLLSTQKPKESKISKLLSKFKKGCKGNINIDFNKNSQSAENSDGKFKTKYKLRGYPEWKNSKKKKRRR